MKKYLLMTLGLSFGLSALFTGILNSEHHLGNNEPIDKNKNEAIKLENDSSSESRPKGIHGLVWGDNINKLKNAHLYYSNKNTIKYKNYYLDEDDFPTEQCYVKNHDQLTFGAAKIARIEYCFMDNKFSAFHIYVPTSHPEKYEGQIKYYVGNDDIMNESRFGEALSLIYKIPPGQDKGFSYLANIENSVDGYVWDEKIKTDPSAKETNKIKLTYHSGAYRDYDSDLDYLEVKDEGYYQPFSDKIKTEYLNYQKQQLQSDLGKAD